ncbi:MAG: hypothetical protein B6D39_04450 [Anaerolineae bacterium UTCFX2]|jgi:hypothetical protein|nr:hypothetical protein [Anaerolineae bacterium]MCZ7551778.1 hypothetical protein [Anaerolineales bacterium]OQY92569.1 MAG: hypothetical protein B6D39_04450 [Anaerolineae bacterium UTCFX2]
MDRQSDTITSTDGSKPRRRRTDFLWLRVGLLLALLIPSAFQPASSHDLSAPDALPTWTLLTVDGPRFFTNMTDRSLAFRGETPCAVYGGDNLYFACLNSTTGSWESQVLDNSVGVGQYASLAFYNNLITGKIEGYTAYYDALNGQLKFMYTSSQVWQAPIVVPNPPPGALILDTSGWENPDNSVEITPEEGVVPEEEVAPEEERDFANEMRALELPWLGPTAADSPDIVVESEGVGKYTSIAVDGSGVYISYYDDRTINASLNQYERNLKVATWRGGSNWTIKVVDDYRDQGAVGLWSSIAVDSSSNLHVAYFDEKYDDLKYAFWRAFNGKWATPVTVDGNKGDTKNLPRLGSMCSIALLDNQAPGVKATPYISYLDWTPDANNKPQGRLKMARLVDLSINKWDLEVVDSTGITGWWTSIAIEPINKRVNISYYQVIDKTGKSTGDLRLATKKVNGTWEFETVRAKAGLVGQFSSIAIRPTNLRPSIFHYNATRSQLEYTYYRNRVDWGTHIVDYNGNDVGFASSLALTGDGIPNISYYDATLGMMKYARQYGNMGIKYYPLTNFLNGYYSSIQLAPDGNPRIASYGSKDGDLIFGALGTSWEFKYIDRTFDVGRYVSMAIGTNNIVHASYFDATHKDLVYAHKDLGATTWITDTLDWSGDVGMFTSIALSSDNRPYISYYDAEREKLKIAFLQLPSFWNIQTVDDGGVLKDNVGWFSSVALDSADNPHISYYDVTNKDLKYAYWNGAAWVTETLQSTGNVGMYTSLKIYTPTDTRHMCYYDATNGALRYAQYSGGVWQFQLVHDFGDVGYSCSLDLTAAGDPAISYYDNTRGDLLLAISYGTIPNTNPVFLPIISAH